MRLPGDLIHFLFFYFSDKNGYLKELATEVRARERETILEITKYKEKR